MAWSGKSRPLMAMACATLALVTGTASGVILNFASRDSSPSGQMERDGRGMLARTGLPEVAMPEIAAIVDRPLFSMRRAPPPAARLAPPPIEAAAHVPADPVPTLNHILAGIAISPRTRKALLRASPGDPGEWLVEGGVINNGWKLVSISSNAVKLSSGRHQTTLFLHETGR